MAGLVRDVRRKLEATSNAFRNWRTQFGFLLLLSVNATVTWAEAVLDGTRGSTGSYSGHFTISEDFGETSPDGKNLFHSFSVFNINAGESATFTGSDSINNVISRVTGSSGTTINGPLISEIANADFYFINPNGVIFDENAAINVPGSFHTSTADYVKLGNDGFYFADATKQSTLSTARPSAFGFVGPSPAAIEVGSFLEVPAPNESGEKMLSLVAGNIDVGREEAVGGVITPSLLLAPAGRINLVGVASGEVRLNDDGMINVASEEASGEINIRGGSIVDGKEVVIRGGQLVIEDSLVVPGFFSLDRSKAFVDRGYLSADPDGGKVDAVLSGDIEITGRNEIAKFKSGISTFAGRNEATGVSGFKGDVPEVTLKADIVSLSGVANIKTDRFGDGTPGNVTIEANKLEVVGGASVDVLNFFHGAGGRLAVHASHVLLDGEGNPDLGGDGASDFTGLGATSNFNPSFNTKEAGDRALDPDFTTADSAHIIVDAVGPRGFVVRHGAEISTESRALGSSGDITINATNVSLSRDGANFGAISTQSLFGGDSGDITVKATTGKIEVIDGFRISASTAGTGDGGTIKVAASDSITLTGDGSAISTVASVPTENQLDTLARTRIDITYEELLQFTREQLDIRNPGLIDVLKLLNDAEVLVVQDQTPGDGGDIVLLKTPQVTVRGGGLISTASVGTVKTLGPNAVPGNAGDVMLRDTDTVTLQDKSSITVSTEQASANAGNITINAKTLVHLRNQSAIETSAAVIDTEGTGQGGDITIDPQIVVLDGASVIRANAAKGEARNIKITITDGGALFQSPDSIIEASAGPAGIDGTVEINRTDSDIINSSLVLPDSFLDVATLLGERCTARAEGDASTFVVSGRSGMPPGPDAFLPDYISDLDEEPAVEQGNGAIGTLPGGNDGKTVRRLSRIIFECPPG